MSDKVDRAVDYFENGYCCSQAVLAAYSPDLGLDRETAVKVASGFAGGMGRMSGPCGALTGAFMVFGLKYGSADAEDKALTCQHVRDASAKFKARNGSISCAELLGFDMTTEEGALTAKKPGSFDLCSKLVKDAAEIVEEIIGTSAMTN